MLGTIPGSVLHALLVRQWSDDVIFFAHTYDLTADEQRQLDARGIRTEHGVVARLVVENDRLTRGSHSTTVTIIRAPRCSSGRAMSPTTTDSSPLSACDENEAGS